MSAVHQQSVYGFHLQQLQGIKAVKHPLGQVGDLISIQHAEKSQHRHTLDTENDNWDDIHTYIHAQTWLWGHLQGVEGAQALEGIRSYLWDLIVAQVSVWNKTAKKFR